MEEKYGELRTRLGEYADLLRIWYLLSWDQQTMMAPKAAPVRAEQLATVMRTLQRALSAPELGRLLEELRPYAESLPYESDEASLIRVARRDHEKAVRVPPELRGARGRASSLAIPAWIEARRNDDYTRFLPHLRENLRLAQEYVACFDDREDPYDVLLDDFDPQLRTAEVREVFDRVKPELIELVQQVAGDEDGDEVLRRRFPIDRQREFALSVIERFGFRSDSWRLDVSAHPFASGSAIDDIRLTTRYDEHHLNGSLFGAMHETGHGLYENGVDRALERTPLARGASMSLHESQSRLWENLVGRSRPFWRHFYPRIQEAFPEALGDVDEETFFRAVNHVRPSLIRVEADEATYSLHIILRFELEQELLSGALALEDLPEAWRARMREYLGVEVPNDADGVLQDIHWPSGSFGYFSPYALGNVVSLQIWEQVRAALPDLDEQIERGEFAPLREWLGENLYRHGRKFTTPETLERLTGGGLDPEPYLRYLRTKLGELYGVPA